MSNIVFKCTLTMILVSSLFLKAFSQDDRYYHWLIFSGDIIKSNLEDKQFDYFKFSFEHKFLSGFVLSGKPYRMDSTLIPGRDFTLSILVHSQKKKLKNIERGTLILSRKRMHDQGVDGTFDCFLMPKKTGEGTRKEKDYVSYRVLNSGNDFQPPSFQEFDCDPSPPYD